MPRGRRHYSENRSGSKQGTGESLPLDVRKLHRGGWLAPGISSSSRWWRGPNKANGSSIGILAGDNGVTLLYSHRGESITQQIALDWTPCNYGGSRPWWLCPACGRRVAIIYGAGKHFACRHCHGLCYESQKESGCDRAMRAAFKIRESLGDDGPLNRPFPDKPKGMRWATYARIRHRGEDAEGEVWGAVSDMLGRS